MPVEWGTSGVLREAYNVPFLSLSGRLEGRPLR